MDTSEFPGAYELGGRYQVKGDKVSVNLGLFHGEQEVATFLVTGDRTRLEALADVLRR